MIGGFIEQAPSGRMLRAGWERMSVYLPVILMGFIALGTYWLARNTPTLDAPQAKGQPTHEPDSYMRGFAVRSFDASGRLKSELHGVEARHYPDTDTVEIDTPRMRLISPEGDVTVATAKMAVSNADASEIQLVGDAVVTREARERSNAPRIRFHGEFLHVYVNTERVTSNKPVELLRGEDRLTADSMAFDNVSQVLEMSGRVRGSIPPRTPR